MDKVWQDRWQTLAEQLQDVTKEVGPNNKSLQALADSLLAFGKDQFQFFWKGFNSGQLLPSMTLPEEHVLRATLDQVAFDMSIIQRIHVQRSQKSLRQAQELADKLAQMALTVAIDGGLLPKCSVLTYFNKSANIRIIPYAPIALIGVPFSAVKVNKDLLAIPHEVGHFVYHHAPGLAAQLHDCIPLYPNWINHWIEEIFADAFAAYVAGPVAGLSLQEIMMDNSQEKFVEDDGEHPPDAVRPFGFNHALRHLGDTQIANELDKLWENHLTTRHYPKDFVPHNSMTATDLEQAQELLTQTTVLFLNLLKEQRGMKRPKPWTDGQQGADTVFASFDKMCSGQLTVEPLQLSVEGKQVGVCKPGGVLENSRPLGSTQTWRDWIKTQSRANTDTLLPAQAWTPIFTAGHWPVKGPEGNSGSGL